MDSMQSLSSRADVMITDFGSSGAEWKLTHGKRVIFLKVPKTYAGGADLLFRDHFADAVCEVGNLTKAIKKTAAMTSLDAQELTTLRQTVLSCADHADKKAADVLYQLATESD